MYKRKHVEEEKLKSRQTNRQTWSHRSDIPYHHRHRPIYKYTTDNNVHSMSHSRYSLM